jgi:deoxyribodipyrimidine photo-lyase type I
MNIFWHRRDLRATDNVGLAQMATDGVLPVFIFDPAVMAHASPPRMAFLLDAVAALREWYREQGGELVIRQGDPAEVLVSLAEEQGATTVGWNRDYSGLARRRDAAVRRALADVDIERRSFDDAVFHPPGEIMTNQGDPYAVYTYFWRKWQDREKPQPVPAPSAAQLRSARAGQLPQLAELGFDAPDATVPDAGMGPAAARLETFCQEAIYRYEQDRDYPARGGTSRLSADLKYGTVGIRTVYAATEAALAAAPDEAAREAVEAFQSQLAWREFYTQVLFYHPHVVDTDYRSYEHPIAWREDADALTAWKRGETGYPIVDAGMRQLRAEAYMHNRVRMIVASFLTKDLLLDWREGYDHFRRRLVDHDTANDTGGWQWAASTGTDAQPYFRIFNPMTQGERYDPDATYIKRYVPELAGATPAQIHGWHELEPSVRSEVAPAYPAPIVEHSQRREAALSMFEAARGDA